MTNLLYNCSRKVLWIVLVFALCFMLSSKAEEVEQRVKELFFIPSPTETLNKEINKYKEALESKDYRIAARLFAELRVHKKLMVSSAPGVFIPLSTYLEDSYKATGDVGLAIFREYFDPNANLLYEEYLSSGDIEKLSQIELLYPFASNITQVFTHLGCVYADRCDFLSAQSCFKKVCKVSPEVFGDRNLLSLYQQVVENIAEPVELEFLAQLVKKLKAEDMLVDGKPVLEHIQWQIDRIEESRAQKWENKIGGYSGVRESNCNVNEPVLAWAAYNNFIELDDKMPLMERFISNHPNKYPQCGADGMSSVAWKNRIFLFSRGKLICRDAFTGRGIPIPCEEMTKGFPSTFQEYCSRRNLVGANERLFYDQSNPRYRSVISNGLEGEVKLSDERIIRTEEEEIERLKSNFAYNFLPIVNHGKMFLLGKKKGRIDDVMLQRIDLKTNVLDWEVIIGSHVGTGGFDGEPPTPVFGGGSIYIMNKFFIAAVDVNTGKVNWIANQPYQGRGIFERVRMFYLKDSSQLLTCKDGANYVLLDAHTGEVVRTGIGSEGYWIGVSGNTVYHHKSGSIWGFNVETGEGRRVFDVPSDFPRGTIISSDKLYLVINNTLLSYDLKSCKHISSVDLSVLRHIAWTQIVPLEDKILLFADRATYCLMNRPEFENELNVRVERNEQDPLSRYELGRYKFFAGKYLEAVEEFRKTKELSSAETTYCGAMLWELIEKSICTSYSKALPQISDPLLISDRVNRALKDLSSEVYKAQVGQYAIVYSFNSRREKEAIRFIFTSMKWNALDWVQLEESLRFGCLSTKQKEPSTEYLKTLKEVCVHLILRYAEKPEGNKFLEELAKQNEQAIRQGDVEIAQKTLGFLGFTDNSKRIFSQIALEVLEGKASQKVLDMVVQLSSFRNLSDMPQLRLARVKAISATRPFLAATLAKELDEAFSSTPITGSSSNKTIGDYAKPLYMSYPGMAKKEKHEFRGLVRILEDEAQNRKYNRSISVAAVRGSKGIILAVGDGDTLACFNPETEEEVWRIPAPKHPTYGISLAFPQHKCIVKKSYKYALMEHDEIIAVKSVDFDSEHYGISDYLCAPGYEPAVITVKRRGMTLEMKLEPYLVPDKDHKAAMIMHMFKLPDDTFLATRANGGAFRVSRYRMSDGALVSDKLFPGLLSYAPLGSGLQFYGGSLYIRFLSHSHQWRMVYDVERGETRFEDAELSFFQTEGAKLGTRVLYNDVTDCFSLYDVISGKTELNFNIQKLQSAGKYSTLFISSQGSKVVDNVLSGHGTWARLGDSVLFCDGYIARSSANELIVTEISTGREIAIDKQNSQLRPKGIFCDGENLYVVHDTMISYFEGRYAPHVIRSRDSLLLTIDLMTRKVKNARRFTGSIGFFYGVREGEFIKAYGDGRRVSSHIFSLDGRPLHLSSYDVVLDNVLVSTYSGLQRVYRFSTPEDEKALREECATLLATPNYDVREVSKLADKLRLAQLYPELLKLTAKTLKEDRERDEKERSGVDYCHSVARAETAESSKNPVWKLKGCKADGELDEWSEENWIAFPENSQCFPDHQSEYAAKEDLTASFQLGVAERMLCIAVKVRDDRLDSIVNSQEKLRLFIARKNPLYSFPEKRIFLDIGLDFEGKPRISNPKTRVGWQGGVEHFRTYYVKRNEEKSETYYEYILELDSLVNEKIFREEKLSIGEMLSGLCFNLGIVDSDPECSRLKYLELCPSLFSNQVSMLREEVFPSMFLKDN